MKGCEDMKHKKDFLMQKVADMFVVVPVGAAAVSFNALLSFNESGALLWDKLENDVTVSELTQTILKEYEIDEQTACKDVAIFLERLEKVGLLEGQ